LFSGEINQKIIAQFAGYRKGQILM